MTTSNRAAFVLASGSPRRRDLLASLDIEFVVLKPDIDETQHDGEAPLDYVRRLSIEKAQAVAVRTATPAHVLAADTVVILAADTIGVVDGQILGKPTDADDARIMLRLLRGRAHTVCTALTLLTANGDSAPSLLTELTLTTVFMREYSDEEVEAYIATGDPFDKAGSYAIQHEGFHPVERLEGSYTNVVGLPVETLQEMLKQTVQQS
jgi:septum formation protein